MLLSLETLKDFDLGKAKIAFEHALKKVATDCLERPGTKAARKIVFTTNVVPILQQDGDVVDVEIDFTVQAKVPAWQTAAKPLAVTKVGGLLFNDLAMDNPRQRTVDEVLDEDE